MVNTEDQSIMKRNRKRCLCLQEASNRQNFDYEGKVRYFTVIVYNTRQTVRQQQGHLDVTRISIKDRQENISKIAHSSIEMYIDMYILCITLLETYCTLYNVNCSVYKEMAETTRNERRLIQIFFLFVISINRLQQSAET